MEPNSKSLAVSIENLSFAYNSTWILKDINLEVARGEFVGVIGPNGGGKTTLIKLMLGLLRPARGRIKILGRPPAEVSHRIGYVPQDIHLNRNFPVSALDVVLMGRLSPGAGWSLRDPEAKKAALEALARMEMEPYANWRMDALSGGQRQRVFIARALVSQPELLLLDEPTASIDMEGQADFFHLLQELNSSMTIIIVSHDLMLMATHVKSVACVNQHLHYHDAAAMGGHLLTDLCPTCIKGARCPVDLVTMSPPTCPHVPENGND